jgi:hypothetical protein
MNNINFLRLNNNLQQILNIGKKNYYGGNYKLDV